METCSACGVSTQIQGDWDCYYPYYRSGNICVYGGRTYDECVEADCTFEYNCTGIGQELSYCNEKYPECLDCCRDDPNDNCYYIY